MLDPLVPLVSGPYAGIWIRPTTKLVNAGAYFCGILLRCVVGINYIP